MSPCHHVTWEWGVAFDFPKKILLQLRREAFDFRFRKAHHRTFDGLTVAEATGGREWGVGSGVFGFPARWKKYTNGSESEAQKIIPMSRFPRCFGWISPVFFLNFLQQPSNLVGLLDAFLRFFSHIKLATKFVDHLWSFLLVFTWPGRHLAGWFFLCPAGWSSVPWPKFYSVAAGEQRIQTNRITVTITKTFLNESWILPIPVSMVSMFFIFPAGLFLSSGWVCFMGTSLGKRRYVWSCPVLELWCRCNRSAGKGDVEQRAEFSKFGLVRAKYGWAMESQVTLYCCIQLYIDR